jgi:hypothetical protein
MSTTTPSNPYVLLNERNQLFWERESELLIQRIQDPCLYKFAMREMTNEELRGVPLRNRKGMTQAFADVASIQNDAEEETKKSYHVEFASKGGRAPKSDRLQKLIYSIVCRNPQISVTELLDRVLEEHGFERIDDSIAFDKGNGAEKLVPIRALKDRLSRAKKRLHSR